jgi:chromosome segregation ATPase
MGGALGKTLQLAVHGLSYLYNFIVGDPAMHAPAATLNAASPTVPSPDSLSSPTSPRLANNRRSSPFIISALSVPNDQCDILHHLFTELEAINLKAEGWPSKITALRTKLLSGNEEAILKELERYGNTLSAALLKSIATNNESTTEIETLLEKGLIKKLRVMFHPDKSASPLATQISQWLEGWCNKTREMLHTQINSTPYADFIRKMEADIQEVREAFARIDAGIARLDAGITRLDAGIARLDAGIAKVSSNHREISIKMTQMKAEIKQMKDEDEQFRSVTFGGGTPQ